MPNRHRGLDVALAAGDAQAAREAFVAARNANGASDLTEGRAFFDGQALFRDAAAFPELLERMTRRRDELGGGVPVS